MIPSIEELSGEFARRFPAPPAVSEPAATPPAADAAAGAGSASQPAQPAPRPASGPVLNFAAKGCHLDFTVPPSEVVAAAELLDQRGFAMDTVTGVDWMAQEQMEVVYDFLHPQSGMRVAVRARIPRGQPEIPTISEVFPGANWHERETHDFFGIRFLGHPDLTPLLLPEDADYHPLRKDFTA